jgi:two-component system sensor histidine kinase RegB
MIKLRWVAVVGQLITIGTVMYLLGIQIPLPWALLVVILATAVSNIFLTVWLGHWRQLVEYEAHHWNLILGLVMVMDLLSLTTLLFATGGPNNPFWLFYFVNLTLSALILSRNWAWALNLLSVICFAFLLYEHDEIAELNLGQFMVPIRQAGSPSLVQLGLLIAYTASSSVLVYFMTRLTAEMGIQESNLRVAQQQQSRSEKLEALGTLAAGTAHELATPLSTIAVVARDVERFFEDNPLQSPGADEVIDDIHLIRSQLDRCRSILNRMAGQAGQAIGESIQLVSVADFWEAVLADLPNRDRIRMELNADVAAESIHAPLVVLSQAIRGLVQNALDADVANLGIEIELKRFASHWHWEIHDRGAGMSPDVLNRVSEPFFTTKPTGKGMGLGVFLARNVIERLDGSIDFQSTSGSGTRVTIRLPRRHRPESENP